MTLTVVIVAALLQAQVEAPARITDFQGTVELGDTVVTRAGDLVVVGDRLHTSREASLTLSIEPGVALKLKSDTRTEMKNVNGEPVVVLTEGSISVRSTGKPVRVETRYGQIKGTEGFQEFEVAYSGECCPGLAYRRIGRSRGIRFLKGLVQECLQLWRESLRGGQHFPHRAARKERSNSDRVSS